MDYTIQKGKTIIIKSSKKVRQISVESIIYVSYDSFLISIFLQNQKKPDTIVSSLKEIEADLKDFYFFKINRNQLINLRHFRSYNNYSRDIIMTDNIKLNVSRRKWFELKNHF